MLSLICGSASAVDLIARDAMRVGYPLTVGVQGDPGATVSVAVGPPGRTCPPELEGLCWDLAEPEVLGTVVLDESGIGEFGGLYDSLGRDTVLLQGIQLGLATTPVRELDVLRALAGDVVVDDRASLNRLRNIIAVEGTVTFAPGDYDGTLELPYLGGCDLVIQRPISLSFPSGDYFRSVTVEGVDGPVLLKLGVWRRDDATLTVADNDGPVSIRLDATDRLGELALLDNRAPVTVRADALTAAHSVLIAGNRSHVDLSVPALSAIGALYGEPGGLVVIDNPGLSTLELPSLSSVTGMELARNARLGFVGLGLETRIGRDDVGSWLTVLDNPVLAEVAWGAPTVSARVEVAGNPVLPTCDVAAVVAASPYAASCADTVRDACADDGACSLPVDLRESGLPPTLSVTVSHVADHARVPLVCVADASDPEGSPVDVSFSWEIDGVPWDGPAGNTHRPGDTVPAGIAGNDEEWACLATATDGVGVSEVASDSVRLAAPGGNVLLVIIDDVGLDKVTAYGMHPDTPPTPTIDGLMADGITFTTAYAHPSCSPARAALMTGRHIRRTGVGNGIALTSDPWELAYDEETIPEMLASADAFWDNALVGKWHLSSALMPGFETHPLTQGFHWFEGANSNLDRVVDVDGWLDTHDGEAAGYWLWERNTNGVLDSSRSYATTEQVDVALEQVGVLREPWFLTLSLSAAHLPWEIPPDPLHGVDGLADHSEAVDVMDAMVEALDTELGRLFAGMDPELLARTTTILVGDNGTAFQVIREPWNDGRSKLTLYEGGVRVPLIVTGPLVTEPGLRSDAMVHVVDVFPTVADIAGVDLEGRVIDGISLLGHVADPTAPSARTHLFTERMVPNGPPPYTLYDGQTIRTDKWKLMVVPDRTHLFELTPGEFSEGPDMIFGGGPTERRRAALESLEAALAAQLGALPFGL